MIYKIYIFCFFLTNFKILYVFAITLTVKANCNLDVKQRIGRRILEEAQSFCPEVPFLDHVEITKGK